MIVFFNDIAEETKTDKKMKYKNPEIESILDSETNKKFGTWVNFSNQSDENSKNFKRKILQNVLRLNNWIGPLGLKITIVKK